jgi:glycosyltransferase involved in cell wall biosynthesis
MRIALVSREVSPFFGAGIGAYVTAMARAWSAAGHEVHVLTAAHPGLRGADGERAAALELPGVRVHLLGADAPQGDAAAPRPPAGPGGSLPPRLRFEFQRHAMAALEALERLHADIGPGGAGPLDYIEFPDYGAEGAFAVAARRVSGRLPGAVLAVRLHTPTRECREINGEAWLDEEVATLERMEDEAIAGADAVVSPSLALLERVSRRLGLQRGEAARVRAVAPYPFDGACVAGEPPPAASQEESDRPLVLYFGRLERRKGVELLALAADRLLEGGIAARFLFVGGDTTTGGTPASGEGQRSMRKALEELVRPQHRGMVEVRGAIPRGQIASLVRAAADSGGLCCFPSLWENFPNALLEAMSLGSPVVASDAGGMAEVVQDGRSGVLFRSGDTGSLAAAIRRVLGDSGLRRTIAEGAPARVRELCEPGAAVAQMEAVIERVREQARIRGELDDAAARLDRSSPRLFGGHDLAELDAAELATGTPESAWVLVREGGGPGRPRVRSDGAAAVREAIRRDEGLSCVAFLSEDERGVHTPVGLDRDLLTSVECGAFGAMAVRREALEMVRRELGSGAFHGPGALWRIAAIIARGGGRAGLIPEVLVSGAGPRPAAEQAALAVAVAVALPDLAADAGRSLRIQHGVAAAELRRLRAELEGTRAELTGRIRALEEHLACPRYRLADRVNDAAKSLGIQPVIKVLTGRRARPRT